MTARWPDVEVFGFYAGAPADTAFWIWFGSRRDASRWIRAAAQLGAGLAHPTLVRVHHAAGGNAFFALELARALRGREAELVPGQPLPVPKDLSALVGARLAGLGNGARQAVQVVAALSQPTSAGSEETMVRAVALEDPGRQNLIFGRVSMLAGMVWMRTERLDQARDVFERLYHLALDRGEESVLPRLGMFAACLSCRMGDLDAAAGYARTSLQSRPSRIRPGPKVPNDRSTRCR